MAEFIGSRCDFEGHIGTIRFHGNVPPSSGEWFGVEWDEKRGKHDGTFEGKSYFKCREQHGSFVRPHKVHLGINIIQALEKRYGAGYDSLEETEVFVLGENKQKTLVEMVGFEKVHQKQRQYQKLYKACFPGMYVSEAGPPKELEKMAPNIHDLDVSKNLFSCWLQVAVITRQLQHLEILNISENKMEFPDNLDEHRSSFENIKILFANRMGLSWKEVLRILSMAVNLNELHMCFNSITQIDNSNIEDMKNLKLLNLEGNGISNWNDVLKLSKLENLETLILNDNSISKIDYPSAIDGAVNVGFSNLLSISLSNNKISEWYSVNNLAKIESLKSVRFKGNPICEGKKSLDLRQELIARLKQAEAINGSKITAQERQNAKLDYMMKYSEIWRTAVGTTEYAEFKELHPRYDEYIKEYGEPVANTTKKPKTLKEKLILLNFKCPDCSDKKTFTKKLPATMTIQQLKTLLQRLYKIKSYEQQLTYFDSKTNSEIEMDDNLRDLFFYSISQNDTVLVRW